MPRIRSAMHVGRAPENPRSESAIDAVKTPTTPQPVTHAGANKRAAGMRAITIGFAVVAVPLRGRANARTM
jgi:hypothetical protein